MVMAYAGEDWSQPELIARLGEYGILGNAMRAPDGAGEPRTAFRLGTVGMTIRGLSVDDFTEIGRQVAAIFAAGPRAPLNHRRLDVLRQLANAHPVPSFVD
jgi:glycine hydroxymethyltransferase